MNKISCLLVIILLFSCAAVQERLAIKECKFSFISAKPYAFTFNNLKLDFDIKVDNPNSVDAVLDRFTYTFLADESAIFSGTTGKGIKIPAKKSNTFTTTMTLEYNKIGQVLVSAIKLGGAAYKVKATAFVNTILGEISYPVEITLQ